jgi:hypothetical protein
MQCVLAKLIGGGRHSVVLTAIGEKESLCWLQAAKVTAISNLKKEPAFIAGR